MISSLNIRALRDQFPGLLREVNGRPAVFFDGPAGSQVPQRVADAVSRYLLTCNANHGGVFATSVESDTILEEARRAAADLVGTNDPGCVVFGPNMTTLTFALSRALAKTWQRGDEVIVTRLDHDANVSPWVRAARDAGATVHFVGFRPDDCTLDLDDFGRKLSSRTRLVAVGCASNSVGTINPFQRMIEQAHAVGGLVFLDAVHYAPHLLMDAAAWGCDFLACSAYKFFGPHVGLLYGKRQLMETLPAYRVRPAGDQLPGRWETGTQNHEGIAGVGAAVEYLADLGRTVAPAAADRRLALRAAFAAIAAYERELLARLLNGLAGLANIRVYGIADPARLGDRVPTVSFRHARHPARRVAELLSQRGVFVWHGNYYALELTESLGLEPEGMVRVGILHYNTAEEVDRLLAILTEL